MMHGSTSPSQYGWPPSSQRALAPMSSTARSARSEEGSRPNSTELRQGVRRGRPRLERDPTVGTPGRLRSGEVEIAGEMGAAHRPSSSSKARSRAPQPSVSTLARSAAHRGCGAPSTSRITCHRIDGSECSGSRSDVARYLGVTRQRVQQLAAEGHLPSPAGADHRGRYWNREDLQELAVGWAAARRWRRLTEVRLSK